MFYILHVGTVPILCILDVGTVPTFRSSLNIKHPCILAIRLKHYRNTHFSFTIEQPAITEARSKKCVMIISLAHIIIVIIVNGPSLQNISHQSMSLNSQHQMLGPRKMRLSVIREDHHLQIFQSSLHKPQSINCIV